MAFSARKRGRIRSLSGHSTIYLAWSLLFVQIGIALSSSSIEKGSVDVQSFCTANKIKVRKLILLCDSPGAYYYGSNTYRNSKVCMSNDKANLQLYFTISDRYTGGSNVRLSLEAGIYNAYTTVMDNVPLCQLGISGDNAYRCPKSGDYILKTYFYVPAIHDYNFHYTPDVKFTFSDGYNGTTLGCAVSGTLAMHKRADKNAQKGLVALGLCTLCFVVVFGGLLLASYRRKKEIQQYLREQKTSRYYIQTMANGNVVVDTDEDEEHHGPGHTQSTRVKPAIDDHHARRSQPLQQQRFSGIHNDELRMNISNPIYNETQVPIRPVI